MSALPSNKFDFLCQDVRKRSGLVLGQEKGATTEARLRHNFGMARPEGYRKALQDDPHLLAGLNVHRGELTYRAVAEATGHGFTAPEEAVAA